MRIRETNRHEEKIELQMAPMIDIVFQLLIFFIMTFKIVTMEGDFNIKMPKGATSAVSMDFEPPMTIKLDANIDGSGNLHDIIIQRPTEDVSLGKDYQALTNAIIEHVGRGAEQAYAANSTEIIFDCSESLKYEVAINAITAVTGYKDRESGELVRLVENIKFKKPESLKKLESAKD